MKERKVKNPEAVGFKECVGVTALSTVGGLSSIFMSALFMQYMTDYAGLGAWGATLATVLLLVARIFDAVDDPIQSYIMDNAKIGKHGKYKPFFMLSIIMTAIGTIALYSLPEGITDSPVLVGIWVIVFYLFYDIGMSFNNANLLYRTMTDDTNERSKLVIGPRLWVNVLGIIGAAMIIIVVAIYNVVGNYHTAFTILVSITIGISAAISVIGWFMVKERHIVRQEEGEKIRISEFFQLLKVNKAMVVHFVKCLFSGFIWMMLFATPAYYVKWGYCTNLATGEVDMAKFGMYSMFVTLMMLVPLVVGAVIATPLMKKIGSPIKMTQTLLIAQAVGGGILFVAQILGILRSSPWLFFGGMFIMALAIGTDFVPQCTVEMEIMDYTIYKTGKDRSAMTSVLNTFLQKAQSAVSSALIGVILIAIGYNVDSVTGDYAGDLANIPSMLNWFIVIMGLMPAILGVVSCLVYRFYPIDNDVRANMRKYIEEHNV